jgi:hypothetical protein
MTRAEASLRRGWRRTAAVRHSDGYHQLRVAAPGAGAPQADLLFRFTGRTSVSQARRMAGWGTATARPSAVLPAIGQWSQ